MLPNPITSIRRPFTRVLGGRDVKYRESPWTVQIVKTRYLLNIDIGYDNLCTGSLLTMRHILTAAHCLM